MSKAPTVSEVVGVSNLTFKSSVSTSPRSPALLEDEGIRPDFDTDVLWKGPRQIRKQRTVSVDSTDSEVIDNARKASFTEGGQSAPMEVSRQRRMSISEMIFGSPAGGFSWGQSSLQRENSIGHSGVPEEQRKMSVTEDSRFKELMKHQSKILGDDGIGGGFKKRDYFKE